MPAEFRKRLSVCTDESGDGDTAECCQCGAAFDKETNGFMLLDFGEGGARTEPVYMGICAICADALGTILKGM